ncbi:MAG: 2-oxoglutarate dehydrogenase E1 component [Sphingobacteriales bacterium]|nr:2-oxoglutarate dehydrogenase E1 component [Sphingobacteriales bacterium]
MSSYSYISNAHPSYIDALYRDYQTDANSVDNQWRSFFEGFEFATNYQNGSSTASNQTANHATDAATLAKELKVFSLINGYRHKGHLLAKTNPVRPRRNRNEHLALKDYGLTDADLPQTFAVGSEIGLANATLAQIIEQLEILYCGSIGIEYGYITNPEAQQWLKERFENRVKGYGFKNEQKMRILHKLNETVVFERFLHQKFVGQKRFSLEGGETTIPALDAIINKASENEVEEIVIGMAHRGRLNVLVNIMGKSYSNVFTEFEGDVPQNSTMGSGDVKYHLGYSSLMETDKGKQIYLKLVPNPSHLEAADPVVEGFARAKTDGVYAHNRNKILPILIHGDAAVAGQGVVYEILQMSQLEGYYTGGTVHFVINNQIGFTTNFEDARSADYSTSLAQIIKAPVFHVNGDDVEAVIFVCELATEYRQKFNTDVFIDMVCYRKYGHNEGDDPQFTQPTLYKLIAKLKNPRDLYSETLTQRGEIDAQIAQEMDKEFWQQLQVDLDLTKQKQLPYTYQEPELAWKALRRSVPTDFEQSPITGLSKETINQLAEGLSIIPTDFHPLPKAQRQIEQNRKTMRDNKTLNWAAAELMAYGSLLLEGQNVRMSGQDVKRGTFSHRHAVLFDEETAQEYNRLNNLADKQGKFLIYNSFLSEYAVLGFEYGYSLASPDTLTIWEAQFGDFANGAQIIIDQFVASSESKWQRMSGIVMLLPHGYEGQGPEHSSARLERFLQLCAEDNICVANITEPANLFHALRRQQHRPFRKPLIIMTPKSMLRVYESSIFDVMDNTRFREIIDDHTIENTKKVRRVVLCSGKIWQDLQKYRTENNITDIALVRLEQLYPIAHKQLNDIVARYPKKTEFVWVQEEPANAGAWSFINQNLPDLKLRYIGRAASASPATGFAKKHAAEQADIIQQTFA